MAENTKGDKELASYADLSGAITFFLYESFRHLENEIRTSIAAKIFSDKIKGIETTEEDNKVVGEFSSRINSTMDLIRFDGNPISEDTLQRLAAAWSEAQDEAEITNHKFPVTKELNGRDLLGHITNFAFVIEILLNRHLFILNLHGEIDNFEFNTLDKASVINKIIYLFKYEIKEKKFNPDRISRLFQLRNFAVHFTRDNSQKFKATIEGLIEIWKESHKLMEIMNAKEDIKDNDFHLILTDLKNSFIANYTFKKT